jgi:hypothetical protein
MPTYIAFAAEGNTDMFASDIKYYRLLTAWNAMKGRDFELINPHDRGPMLREGSKEETIKRTLRSRLDKSKRMLLLVGDKTKFDDDFVPYEIEYAIDSCKLPIIVCYVNLDKKIVAGSTSGDTLRKYLPKALLDRIDNDTARTIHIPFRQEIIAKAMQQYNKGNMPPFAFSAYTNSEYSALYKPGEI